MSDHQYDVVGIGNAIVDVISTESHDFINTHNLTKGSMTLIDADRATELYAAMSPAIETSGGSAANTMAGLASFGSRAAYIGKVRDDQLGEVFRHDIAALGVDFCVPSAATGPPTARCLIIVTPDALRTMNTYLGVSTLLHPEDIPVEVVGSAQVLYCEGYIWDVPVTKQAIRRAISICRGAGGQIAFTLADGFCVERHRQEWLGLLDGHIDVLFGNEEEFCALFETNADLPAAVAAVQSRCQVAAITLGARGSLLVTPDEVIEVAAAPVERLQDTTGAGDMYASGFLHGYTSGMDLPACGRLASLAAAEVLEHIGARPASRLADLLVEVGP